MCSVCSCCTARTLLRTARLRQAPGKERPASCRAMRSPILLSLFLLLLLPAAAHAGDGRGTIRVEQQGPDGKAVAGGCYRAASEYDLRETCDYDRDGVVLLDE